VFGVDKEGDGWAASALDVKLPTTLMKTVTARLMAAMKAEDPRIHAVREFFGTLDGATVTGWDRHSLANSRDGSFTSSDDSHLWHVHLSIYRKYATDAAALLPIADVMAGVAAPLPAPKPKPVPTPQTPTAEPSTVARLDALEAKIDALLSLFDGAGDDQQRHSVEYIVAHVVHGHTYRSGKGIDWTKETP